MRRFLLGLMVMLFASALSFAGEGSFTITFKSSTLDSDVTTALTTGNFRENGIASDEDFVRDCTTAERIFLGKKGYGLKFGNSNEPGNLVLDLKKPVVATKIVVIARKYGSDTGNIKIQNTKVTTPLQTDDTEITYTYETPKEISTLAIATTAKRAYVKEVTVYYETVDAPSISCSKNKVTITAEDGTDIYYTTDGTVPTTNSEQYKNPFEILEDVTVKAIAVKADDATSSVAEKRCVFVNLGEIMPFFTTPEAVDGVIAILSGESVTFTAHHAGSIVYSINEGTLITVDGDSYVMENITEDCSISLTAKGDGMADVTAEYTIKVETVPQITFEKDAISYYLGQIAPVETNTLTLDPADAGLEVTYSSSDENVATVDATTGVVTPLAAGTATITATVAAKDHYRTASASYTLTVRNAASTYTLLTDKTKLVDGTKAIIVCSSKNAAMGEITGTNKFANSVAGVAVVDNVVTDRKEAVEVTFKKDEEGNFYMMNGDKYYAADGLNLKLDTLKVAAVISVTSSNDSITLTGGSGLLLYNSTSPRFKPYAGTSSSILAIQIFALKMLAAPKVVCDDNVVTITAEEGVNIYYAFDEDAQWIKYEAPFTIDATVTVKAVAEKDGTKSPEVVKVCKYIDPDQIDEFTTDPEADGNVIVIPTGESVTFTAQNAETIEYTIGETTETVEGESYTKENITEGFTINLTAHRGSNSVNAEYSIQVIPEISFEKANIVYYLGQTAALEANSLNGVPAGVSVTYSSSNENVATVNETNEVVLKGVTGKTVITATTAVANGYASAKASYTITVSPAASKESYALLASINDLVDGTKAIIVSSSRSVAMGAMKSSGSGNNKTYFADSVNVVITNNVIANRRHAVEVTFEKDEEGNFYMKNGDQYYSSDSNYNLLLGETTAVADISITNNNASITFDETKSYLKYNASAPRFKNYAKGQTDIQIFVKRELLAPEVTAVNGEIEESEGGNTIFVTTKNASITLALPEGMPAGSQIFYELSQDEDRAKLYQEGDMIDIPVGEMMTVYTEYRGAKSEEIYYTVEMRFPDICPHFIKKDEEDAYYLTFVISGDDTEDFEVYYKITPGPAQTTRMAAPLEGYTQYTEPIDVKMGDEFSYYMEKDGVQSDVETKTVNTETTGVENVAVGSEDDAEYYNLQGVRVVNPGSGVYIRRVGNTATKVMLH